MKKRVERMKKDGERREVVVVERERERERERGWRDGDSTAGDRQLAVRLYKILTGE